jgi:hypothetical protein
MHRTKLEPERVAFLDRRLAVEAAKQPLSMRLKANVL